MEKEFKVSVEIVTKSEVYIVANSADEALAIAKATKLVNEFGNPIEFDMTVGTVQSVKVLDEVADSEYNDDYEE